MRRPGLYKFVQLTLQIKKDPILFRYLRITVLMGLLMQWK